MIRIKDCLRCGRAVSLEEAGEHVQDGDNELVWLVCRDCRTPEEVKASDEETKARVLEASQAVKDLNAKIDATGDPEQRNALKQQLKEAERAEDLLAQFMETSLKYRDKTPE